VHRILADNHKIEFQKNDMYTGEKEDSGKNTTKSVASAYTLTKNDDKEFSRNTRYENGDLMIN